MPWTFYNSSGEAMIEDGAMSIANNTNNRVVTATGADPASLNGESALTFDGEHLTVSDGNLVIGTAGHGIDFSAQASPAAGMTSELLDRYEEGTFTPAITFGGGNTSITYGTQTGVYTRVGRAVAIVINVTLTSNGSSTGSAFITGLPFTNAAVRPALAIGFDSISYANQYFASISPSATTIGLLETAAAGTATDLDHSNLADSALIRLSGTYYI
jgi:hypothetical protein